MNWTNWSTTDTGITTANWRACTYLSHKCNHLETVKRRICSHIQLKWEWLGIKPTSSWTNMRAIFLLLAMSLMGQGRKLFDSVLSLRSWKWDLKRNDLKGISVVMWRQLYKWLLINILKNKCLILTWGCIDRVANHPRVWVGVSCPIWHRQDQAACTHRNNMITLSLSMHTETKYVTKSECYALIFKNKIDCQQKRNVQQSFWRLLNQFDLSDRSLPEQV